MKRGRLLGHDLTRNGKAIFSAQALVSPLPAAMTVQQSPSSHPFHPGTVCLLKVDNVFFVQLSVLHCHWCFMIPGRKAHYYAGNPKPHGIRLASHQAQHNVHTLSHRKDYPILVIQDVLGFSYKKNCSSFPLSSQAVNIRTCCCTVR